MKSSSILLLWAAFVVLMTATIIMMREDANHFFQWSNNTAVVPKESTLDEDHNGRSSAWNGTTTPPQKNRSSSLRPQEDASASGSMSSPGTAVVETRSNNSSSSLDDDDEARGDNNNSERMSGRNDSSLWSAVQDDAAVPISSSLATDDGNETIDVESSGNVIATAVAAAFSEKIDDSLAVNNQTAASTIPSSSPMGGGSSNAVVHAADAGDKGTAGAKNGISPLGKILLAPDTISSSSLPSDRNHTKELVPQFVQPSPQPTTRMGNAKIPKGNNNTLAPPESTTLESSGSLSEISVVSTNNNNSFLGRKQAAAPSHDDVPSLGTGGGPPQSVNRQKSTMGSPTQQLSQSSQNAPVKSSDNSPALSQQASSINPNKNGSNNIPPKMGIDSPKAASRSSINSPPPGSTTGLPENSNSTVVAVPPLSSLIRGNRIIGDVSNLLDFAIVGFPKSGTSSLLRWLGAHPDVQMAPGEFMELYSGKPQGPSNFVRYFHERYRERPQSKRGYKNPRELYEYAGMRSLRQYFHKTKIIIALRHPITWFQSFHNFRKGHYNISLPVDEKSLMNLDCVAGYDLCVRNTKFHSYMYRLGKTLGRSRDELELLDKNLLPSKRLSDTAGRSKIFVYELSQLSDPRVTQDISNFLGLKRPLVPGEKGNEARSDAFDICEDRYLRLRRRLLGIAVNASNWIRNYFLQSPDVVVSSRERFEELLLDWKEDPCLKKKKTTIGITANRSRRSLRRNPPSEMIYVSDPLSRRRTKRRP